MARLVAEWLKFDILKGEAGKFAIGKKLDMHVATTDIKKVIKIS